MKEYQPTLKDFSNPYFRRHLLLWWTSCVLGISLFLHLPLGFILYITNAPSTAYDAPMRVFIAQAILFLPVYCFTLFTTKTYYKSNRGTYYIYANGLENYSYALEIPNTSADKQAVIDNLRNGFNSHLADLARDLPTYHTQGTAYLAFDLPADFFETIKFLDLTTSIGTEVSLVESLPNPYTYTPYIYEEQPDGTYKVHYLHQPDATRFAQDLPPICLKLKTETLQHA